MDNDEAIDMAKLLSTAGAIGAVIGIFYDFGYFVEPGLYFFTFLTFKDHLTSLIFFAPPCLILTLVWIGLRKRSQNTDVTALCWISLVLVAHTLPEPVTRAFPIVGTISFYFSGLSSFILLGYLTSVIIDFRPSVESSKSTVQGALGMAMFGLIVFIAMFANYQYRINVGASQFEVEVTLKPEDKTESRPQPAHLVRAIDDGIFLIFKDAPDRLVFVRKDAVRMLSKQVHP